MITNAEQAIAIFLEDTFFDFGDPWDRGAYEELARDILQIIKEYKIALDPEVQLCCTHPDHVTGIPCLDRSIGCDSLCLCCFSLTRSQNP